jgi:3-oxoadipate enol-lactonase
VASEQGVEAARRWWLRHEIFGSTDSYPAAREQLAAMVARFPAHQWAGRPATPPLPSLVNCLATLAAPTLVLSGALDVPGYREIASVLHREIPGAQRREFPGAGHLLNLEQPAEFTGRLLAFLAQHR